MKIGNRLDKTEQMDVDWDVVATQPNSYFFDEVYIFSGRRRLFSA